MINSTYSLYPFDACLSVFEDFTPRSRPDEELYWDGHCERPAENPDALIPAENQRPGLDHGFGQPASKPGSDSNSMDIHPFRFVCCRFRTDQKFETAVLGSVRK